MSDADNARTWCEFFKAEDGTCALMAMLKSEESPVCKCLRDPPEICRHLRHNVMGSRPTARRKRPDSKE